jgi:hypothetical protein
VDDVNSFCGPLPNQALRRVTVQLITFNRYFVDILNVPLGNADTRAA